MYQGNYGKHDKYCKWRANKSKATVLLTSLVLLMVLIVGTTTAFLIASDDPITNIFNSSKVSCIVNEAFDGTTKRNVTISNTGDTEAYIRAAIVITWKDAENGNVYGTKPVEETDYTISLNLANETGETIWIKGNDGYYYYVKPVAPKDSTEVLIKSCSVKPNANVPAGYGLNVEILASAIQSVPVSVVNEKWSAVHVETPHGQLVDAEEVQK